MSGAGAEPGEGTSKHLVHQYLLPFFAINHITYLARGSNIIIFFTKTLRNTFQQDREIIDLSLYFVITPRRLACHSPALRPLVVPRPQDAQEQPQPRGRRRGASLLFCSAIYSSSGSDLFPLAPCSISLYKDPL